VRFGVAAVIECLALLPLPLWIVALLARRRRGEPIAALVRATLFAVLVSFVLAHVNRWFDVWKSHPYFPSGHETFASCMGAAVVVADRRYVGLCAVLLATLGYALVRAGWHGRFEVIAGFLLGTATLATVQVIIDKAG